MFMGPESPIAVDPRSPIEPGVLSPTSRIGVGQCASPVQTLQRFGVVLDKIRDNITEELLRKVEEIGRLCMSIVHPRIRRRKFLKSRL